MQGFLGRWIEAKARGLEVFGTGPARRLGEEVLKRCRDRGLFIVPKGEVQSWTGLPKSRSWLEKGLDLLEKGSCGEAEGFMVSVHQHLSVETPSPKEAT